MDSILFAVKDTIATITLNRPDKYNAFNREMALLMQEKLEACAKSQEIRCVVITGAGRAFSSGQDLNEATGPDAPEIHTILDEHYNPIITRIRKLDKPVLAVVNGVAAGAGANVALSCDIVVAAQSASFIQAFSRIGLIPDTGGTYFLPRLVGWQRASALFMLGDKIGAEEARQMGMIYKVYPDDSFPEEAARMARTLADLPTRALWYTKQLLNNSLLNNFEDQLGDEEIFQERAAETEDYKEGVKAFLEKRKPEFKGQ